METLSHLIPAFGRALEGQKVLWLGETQADAAREFRRLVDVAPRECDIRKANGQERITAPNGGVLYFGSARTSGRGFNFDRIYAPSNTPAADLENIIPSLATSRDGAVIYY